MDSQYDLIIIGGGPSGTTVGTMLAREGWKVLLLEKEKFPRFHIGESITAFGFEAFKELGVYDELKQMNYVKKKGLEFVMRHKRLPIYFFTDTPNEPDELPWAFQMARSKMDQVLLENCRRSGAEVHERALVKRILFDGDRAYGVEYRLLDDGPEAPSKQAMGRWIIDASGLAGVMNRQLRDNWFDDPLLEKKLAVFSHWKGNFEITNTDQDLNFRLCVHDNQRDWAWFLPIDKHVVSLGVVLSQETAKAERKNRTLEEIFYHYAKDIPYIDEFLKQPGLEVVEEFRAQRDYSYRCKRFFGPGWAIVGDSSGFIDPVFSTGLLIAFNSSFALVEALRQVLPQEVPDLAPMRRYQANADKHYRLNSMLVYLFYRARLDHENFGNGVYMWKHIEWAGWSFRLRFLYWCAHVLTKPRTTLRKWGEQMLFGNPDDDNVFAKIFLVLAENYDVVHQRRAHLRDRDAASEPEAAAA